MTDRDLIARIRAFADARNAPNTPFETGFEGLTLVRSHAPTRLDAVLYRPLMCLVLQGTKESHLGDRPVRFAAGQSLIVSLHTPTVSRVVGATEAEPYVALALELDHRIIRDLAQQIDAVQAAEADPAPVLMVGEAGSELTDAMGRVFDLAERPQVDREILGPMLVREIHYRLMGSGHGGMLRQLGRWDSHASRINRAVHRLQEAVAEPLSVADLAREAGMSPSSFHQHFKALMATTPLQYQKDLRLVRARQQLEEGGPSVSAVAFSVGYESPTQFSREYARKFGEPPSAHLARLSATVRTGFSAQG